MENQRKKKNNKREREKLKLYRNAILMCIVVFAIAIILLVLELRFVKKKNVKQNTPVETPSTNMVVVDKNKITPAVEEINEGMRFDTFVDKVYTEEQILKLTPEEMVEIHNVQVNKKNDTTFTVQKVLSSAISANDAMRIARNECNNAYDKIANSSNVVLETDTYYIVKVEWDYIKNGSSKRYNQQFLLFKEFYYDLDDKTVNTDDINKTKDVLDIKNYTDTFSNTTKRPIQSFIEKDGDKCRYTIYYFDIELAELGTADTMFLTADTYEINPASGLIENVVTQRIGEGVSI